MRWGLRASISATIVRHAKIQAARMRIEDVGQPLHPVVAKEHRRLVAIDEVRGDRLVGQLCLMALPAYRGGSESGRGGIPPAQAGLVTEVAVLIVEGTSVREVRLGPLQQHFSGSKGCAPVVEDLMETLLSLDGPGRRDSSRGPAARRHASRRGPPAVRQGRAREEAS